MHGYLPHVIQRVSEVSQRRVLFVITELLCIWEVCRVYRCCPSLLILPVMLRVNIVEPGISVVENVVGIVIFWHMNICHCFSKSPNEMWALSFGDLWMVGGLSILHEIIQILNPLVEMLCWWLFPGGIYCKEDEYGRCRLLIGDYLHVSHVHCQS